MNKAERDRFDGLLEDVMDALPPRVRRLLDEAPLIVDDRPSEQLLKELSMTMEDDILCGLHSGVPLTERSVTHSGELPETIHLFREGILEEAGGWERWQDEDDLWWGGEVRVKEEIRITLLHEIGHHFGFDEDKLAELGYE